MADRAIRLAWTILSFLVVELAVWSIAALPVVLLWVFALDRTAASSSLRATIPALMIFPSYIVFALAFMVLSAIAMHVTGWRTQPDAAMRIRDLEWNLLTWVRYIAATHLVRVISGTLFRATPIWSFYLRLNGARVERRVYVNSLSVMDHNLLEFGEGTVIGADVHLSGHTVENGVVFTGRVRTGRDVTLGTGSVVGIDVDIGDSAQVGALSMVPKHSRLAAHTVYVGIPIHPMDVSAAR